MSEDIRRRIPAVDQWMSTPLGAALCAQFSREEVVSVVRECLDDIRASVSQNAGALPDFDSPAFGDRVRRAITAQRTDSLRGAINATGIVIHTNLGRAPLAEEAIKAMNDVARGYSTLEYDVEAGTRGTRYTHIEPLLQQLTGAEAALVTNNCAAAVTLALRRFSQGAEVLISRGELIEIGGSFRMPDVIAESGAVMKEVGTTNRTKLSDYTDAITDNTRAILTSHTSNYRIIGFTARPTLAELAALAHERGLVCIQDLGSGMLLPLDSLGIGNDEPTVTQCLEAGADLVAFSGDKILGGPQAGILVGRRDLIEKMRKMPLLRAMRIDKLSLAALAATLRLYLPPNDPLKSVPVLRMLTESADDIAARAQALLGNLDDCEALQCRIVDGVSFAGGGTMPVNEIPTQLLRITHARKSAQSLAAALRLGEPPIVARIHDGALMIDLRTVHPREMDTLTAALIEMSGAMSGAMSREDDLTSGR